VISVNSDVEEFANQVFGSVVCLVGDDKVVAVKEDVDGEVTTKVYSVGEGCEAGNEVDVGTTRVSGRCASL